MYGGEMCGGRMAGRRCSVRVTMWPWLVVLQACVPVVLVAGTLDVRFLTSGRYQGTSQVNCVQYPWPSDFSIRSYEDWRLPKKARAYSTQNYKLNAPNIDGITRRIDFLLSNRDEIIKEHAKLVQDINSMRQVMFFAPLADESKDYDDSIFHEIIETSSTTTVRPTTTRPTKPKNGIPILLLGGSSQKHLVMSQPLKVSKQSISLVGSSVTPLVRHPYPFVTAGSSRHPAKICMSTPITYTATKRPSLWERLIRSILPRYSG